MNKFKIFLYLIIFALAFASCSLVGVNIARETPRKGNVYPKFKQEDSIKGALNSYRICFDVTHYSITIDVNPEKKYIQGFVDITFLMTTPSQIIQIDLFDNMKMDSIVWNNSKLPFTRKYNAVYVNFPKSISGENVIRCYYQGKPIIAPKPPWDGGFVWDKTSTKDPWIGVACELTGASLWWPCKDHISDEPDNGMRMEVAVPDGLTVVSNGRLIHQFKDSSSNIIKEHFVWETNYPINNYNITIYIAKFEHFSYEYESEYKDFMLDYYVLPEHLEKAKEVFKQTNGIIEFYESIFGPYPWPEEGYKLVGSPFEGMEHQTAIAYGSGYGKHPFGYENLDYIILHETAHEWFGNSVSVADYSDIIIHEGFATYAEALYVEHAYGKEEAEKYMRYYGMLIQNKNPIVGPKDVSFWDYNDTDPYLKGAWVLHGLRHIIDNDSLFFDIIHSFYMNNQKSIVSVADFTELVNAKTNQNYDWYFKQYLYKREVPCLQIKPTQVGTTLEIEARWKDVDSDFVMPVKIEINDIPILFYPTTEVQKFIIHDWKSYLFDYNYAYFRLEQVKKFK